MKKIISVVIFLMIVCSLAAQPPKFFKYQGIARDSTGNPVSNNTIAIRISIHRATTSGTIVYQETHAPITNEFGSFNINIGGGSVVSGNFSTIPWNRYTFFQEVEMDITGGSNYVSMGTSQYLSVPYSLATDTAAYSMSALSATNATNAIKADSAKNGIGPFKVQNFLGGNSEASAAIVALVNTPVNGASPFYARNNGLGKSFYAESGNGIFILGDNLGLQTNGRSLLGGNVSISGNLGVNGATLTANSITSNSTITAQNTSGSVPALFAKNYALGPSFYAESGNGIIVLGDNLGLETNGRSLLGGNVDISGVLTVSSSSTLNGNVGISGNVNVTGATLSANTINTSTINATTIHSNGSLTVNGSSTVNGNFYTTGEGQFVSIVADSAVINGRLIVTNSETLNGNLNLTYGDIIVTNGNLNITGNETLSGNLNVQGSLSKASGSFKIDHPLDPMNKYLYHSFVESPDMKNIYDGTVVTDKTGNATVELPEYFDVLNKDYRYQLTCIGSFAQAIVSEEIKHNSFHIKTNKPNIKVSWQVTGIRNDAYAKKHRIVPEVDKEASEKGKYLYPDSYKQN